MYLTTITSAREWSIIDCNGDMHLRLVNNIAHRRSIRASWCMALVHKFVRLLQTGFVIVMIDSTLLTE